MGMSITAKVVVGLYRKDIEKLLGDRAREGDEELLETLIDDEEFEAVPPHYDGSDSAYAVIGIEVAGGEIDWEATGVEVASALSRFNYLTGLTGKVIVTPYVY